MPPQSPQGFDPSKPFTIFDPSKQFTVITNDPEQQKRLTGGYGFLADIGNTALNTIQEAVNTVGNTLAHPVDAMIGMGQMPGHLVRSHMDEAQKAWDAFQKGDRSEGVLRALASIVPVAGPIIANYADADQSGKEKIAGGVIGGLALGKVPEMAAGTRVLPGRSASMNANDARAIDSARAQGVPVNAGVATGNRALQGMIQGAEKTTATGSGAVNRNVTVTQAALDRMGGDIASEANAGGSRMQMGEAGQASFDALQKNVTSHASAAEKAYSTVEQAQQAGRVGPVSFTKVRTLLRPLYDHLTRLNDSTAGLDAATNAGQTKAILDTLMKPQVKQGYGYVASDVPLMDAERVLGNLKEALRSQSNQFGVGSGQLKAVIRVLQNEIDMAAKADPAASLALQEGRLATVKKYQAASMLDNLAGKDRLRSPISAAEQLLSDAGVTKIKRLAVQSPEAVRDLGRAWFEEKFTDARKTNKFDLNNAGREWRQMSDETKRIVYKDAIAKNTDYLRSVDDFFTAANRIQENLNPSGTTAAAANYFKLVTAPIELALGRGDIAAGVVAQDLVSNVFARAMNNPTVVRLMVDGMKIPASRVAERAANIAAVQAILNASLPKKQDSKPAQEIQ